MVEDRPAYFGGMTAETLNRCRGVFKRRSFLMTGRAVQAGVCSGQGELRGAMAFEELPTIVPGRRGVAGIAAMPEFASVGVFVAIGARRGHPVEDEATVAGCAIGDPMAPVEPESGVLVLEQQRLSKRLPAVDRVAVFASGLQAAVRRIYSSGRRRGEEGPEQEYRRTRPPIRCYTSAIPECVCFVKALQNCVKEVQPELARQKCLTDPQEPATKSLPRNRDGVCRRHWHPLKAK